LALKTGINQYFAFSMELSADSIQSHRRAHSTNAIFSIIIPTWNNLPMLQLCIDSIRKNSQFRHQVILHINEGTDGTLEWANNQPDIDYTYSRHNIGVCYALNAARGLMTTDYLLYLNDDMYVCPGWDRALQQEMELVGHHFFFISATAIEPVPQSNCSIPGNYGTSSQDFNQEKLLMEYDKLIMQDWQGATWPPNIIHKDVWDMVGGYSVEFSPGMYSDPDFSMKLWQLGVRYFKGVSKSRVYHFGSVSTKRIKKNKGYYRFISKWGMTSSTLTKYYLRRGEPFDGPLKEPALSFGVKAKNLYKRLLSAFNHSD
jgi:glycosyltransferase involved in cell wall biosynthesis